MREIVREMKTWGLLDWASIACAAMVVVGWIWIDTLEWLLPVGLLGSSAIGFHVRRQARRLWAAPPATIPAATAALPSQTEPQKP